MDTLTDAEIEHLRQWIGRAQDDDDVASLRQARLMAATLDRAPPALGDVLPPLWHWIYALHAEPPGRLGRDGHPARGGFLPPVPLPNRMWAGGSVTFDTPLPIGAAFVKRSVVTAVERKLGRSGELVFVAVEHTLGAGGRRSIVERQDLVYRRPAAAAGGPQGRPGAPAAAAEANASSAAPAATPSSAVARPDGVLLDRDWVADTTQLFRYSALTFNGHRIHYDADYCRQVEGYDGVVVHGPLIATQLALLGADALAADGRALRRFDYRARSPVTLGHAGRVALRLEARRDGAGLQLEALRPDGVVAMQAEAWA